MTTDKDTTRDGGATATAVGERPATRQARVAPPRPDRTTRRAAPSRPPRPAAAKAAVKAPRRVLPARGAPKAPFVLLVVGLLCGGLVSLLLLNTVLAKDSFRMRDLRDSTQRLHQQFADKSKEILVKSQPGELDRRNTEQGGGQRQDDSAPGFVRVPAGGGSTGPGATASGRPQAEVAAP
ncbi:hypothetical protein [Sphaerisporangium corydalis]|uniref:Uncharacterized protein n=1 Tax=Sphaerisporangium corydalis TaxID=1441875 RepID=A0ABV9ELY2_9ACTN|nr:hypothetical protein [Sphaerisporangium corydalis]